MAGAAAKTASTQYMDNGNYGAGGAGAVGRIRLNTRSDSATVDNTKLSPSLTDIPTTSTAGSANTE